LLEKWSARGSPVAGVVVEPIQGEGGDNMASADFFQGLRDITIKVSGSSIFLRAESVNDSKAVVEMSIIVARLHFKLT